MNAKIFILENQEEDRIAVVAATSGDLAIRYLAQAEVPDEDVDDVVEHYRVFWKVIGERPSEVAGAILAVAVDRSEGFEVFQPAA